MVAISVVNNDAEKHIIWLDELLISSACDSSSVTRVVMMFLRFHFFGSFFVESDESDRFYRTKSIIVLIQRLIFEPFYLLFDFRNDLRR